MHILDHWFWFLLTAACVIWYSTITVYVAICGARDIKNMFARLSDRQQQDGSTLNDGNRHKNKKTEM